MAKQALVMGGSYFIGKKIVDVLLDNNYSVYTLNRGTRENIDNRVINLKCDRNNPDEMKSVLNDYIFDFVVDVSGVNRLQIEVLYNSLNKEGLRKLIFISSSAVYNIEKAHIPFNEETPLGENKYWTTYGINKIEAENFLIEKFQNTQTEVVILRPPYVYGENNYAPRESFIFEHVCNNEPVIIPKDGSKYLQFIYSGDLANIILKLLSISLGKTSIFNVGNKKPVTIREWVECCAIAADKNVEIIEYDYERSNRKERDFFPFYNYDNVLEVSKINKLYDIETDFVTGLREAYRWYCENKENITLSESVSQSERDILKELDCK